MTSVNVWLYPEFLVGAASSREKKLLDSYHRMIARRDRIVKNIKSQAPNNK
jgi:hypothetical protein